MIFFLLLFTAAIIHKTLHTTFKDCTVITIAHRLETVMDSDMILVMEKGNAVEYDTPEKLMKNTKGIFYSLVQAVKSQST